MWLQLKSDENHVFDFNILLLCLFIFCCCCTSIMTKLLSQHPSWQFFCFSTTIHPRQLLKKISWLESILIMWASGVVHTKNTIWTWKQGQKDDHVVVTLRVCSILCHSSSAGLCSACHSSCWSYSCAAPKVWPPPRTWVVWTRHRWMSSRWDSCGFGQEAVAAGTARVWWSSPWRDDTRDIGNLRKRIESWFS